MSEPFDRDITYYKFINEKKEHHYYEYEEGLNVLDEEFVSDPRKKCCSGGLYFTDLDNIHYYTDYGIYVCTVNIPADAKVVKLLRKYRTDKLILGPFVHISEFAIQNMKIKWPWYTLTPKFPLEVIFSNPMLRWDWHDISTRTPMKMVLENPKWKWVGPGLLKNPELSMEVITEQSHRFVWSILSKIANITIEDVANNPELPWHYDTLFGNIHIYIADVLAHPKLDWPWHKVSKEADMYTVKTHPHIPWEYGYMSANPNLSIEFVKDNLQLCWDWHHISRNSCITMEIVKSNPGLPWNYEGLSVNPNLNIQMILDNPHEKWSWISLTQHPNITKEHIRKYKHLPWWN